jgi:hypothetical protein
MPSLLVQVTRDDITDLLVRASADDKSFDSHALMAEQLKKYDDLLAVCRHRLWRVLLGRRPWICISVRVKTQQLILLLFLFESTIDLCTG